MSSIALKKPGLTSKKVVSLFNSLDRDLRILLLVLLLNFLLALFYFIWQFLRKDVKKGGMMALFILIAPIVGPLYLIFSSLIYHLIFKRKQQAINLAELSFSKDKIEHLVKTDIQTAVNRVPIGEALEVSNVHSTRRLLLNVLKEDTGNYVQSIMQATSNPDSEVAHYAATAMTDIVNKFKEREKKLRLAMVQEPDNEELIKSYYWHLSEFLKTHVLPQVEEARYLKLLEDLTRKLEAEQSPILNGDYYQFLVEINLTLGRMDQAEIWVEQALLNQRDDLTTYKAALRFYYENQNFTAFKILLAELMASDLRLDHETLELVRFYQHK